jgi:8-oxo-dGTP pyrophosphatase MutT (NUDIX family)
MNRSRTIISNALLSINPVDSAEATDQSRTLAWIESGAPLFRIHKPDNPAHHLVSYVVPVDLERQSLLLVHHRKADLWLPPGGHVEPDEDPAETARRELKEELDLVADFTSPVGEAPLFVTVTQTRGVSSHTDVSFWYVTKASADRDLWYDEGEFWGYRWLTFDQILAIPVAELEPELHRFVRKLRGLA